MQVSTTAGAVSKGLTNNPALPSPPVPPAELDLLKGTFDAAIIAASNGGTLLTAQKDAARAALVAALNKDASYVDIECDDDITILLSSGFEPVSMNRTQVVLAPPKILDVTVRQSGELKVSIGGDPNRKSILGRIKPLGGEFGPVISFKNSRNIIFAGCIAGTAYVMQLCGLGGSTGQSDWSDPITKIAT